MKFLENFRNQLSFFLCRYLHLNIVCAIVIILAIVDIAIYGTFLGYFASNSSLFAVAVMLLTRHKRYKFKVKKEECLEFLSGLKYKFEKFEFEDNYMCTEVNDSNGHFKYTEVIVPLQSNYRVLIEEYNIPKLQHIPKSLLPS